TEFLIAALHHGGGALIVDRPPNPLDPAALAADGRGSQAILDRATSWGRTFTSTHTPEASPCRLLGCLRPEDEVDEIAHRILDRIEAGVAPEDLAVVLRRAEPHALLLRQRFHALGVPFSAHGLPGVALPHRRRLQLLPGLLEQAGLLPLDRWIAA